MQDHFIYLSFVSLFNGINNVEFEQFFPQSFSSQTFENLILEAI